MASSTTIGVLFWFFLAAESVLFYGCGKPEHRARENTTASQEKSPGSTTAEQPDFSPPEPAEVREAVARVYQNVVTLEENRGTGFIAGDFNGDGSQDIAVVVKPAVGMLSKINSEFANWIIGNPRKVVLPDPKRRVQPLPPEPEPVTIKQGDRLLAVIHGHGPSGWRNPKAKQTYLLTGAGGTDLRSQPMKEALGSPERIEKLRWAGSDVIRQRLAGEPGFLYWTGAKYAWYHSPRTALAKTQHPGK